MPPVRILIDGYSLLHHWEALAPGRPRHSAFAREELASVLTRYVDAAGIPLTIVFDGAGAPVGTEKPISDRDLEILFSGPGQTADDIIERVTHRMLPFGEVLVVTDDHAEQNTVAALGGYAIGCETFIREVENTLDDFGRELKDYNQREEQRYKRSK